MARRRKDTYRISNTTNPKGRLEKQSSLFLTKRQSVSFDRQKTVSSQEKGSWVTEWNLWITSFSVYWQHHKTFNLVPPGILMEKTFVSQRIMKVISSFPNLILSCMIPQEKTTKSHFLRMNSFDTRILNPVLFGLAFCLSIQVSSEEIYESEIIMWGECKTSWPRQVTKICKK